MSLADAFTEIVSTLPDDWTDLELDLRIRDEHRYVDAAVFLVVCNAQPYSKHDWHWRLLVAHRFGHAAAVPAVHMALSLLDEVRVLRTEDELLLDTERPGLQALFDALSQFKVGYAAELHKRTLQRGLLSLIGPGSDGVLAAAPGAAEHAHRAGEIAGRAVRTIRTDVGVDVLVDHDDRDGVASALEAAGAVAIGEAVAEAVRIERGRPRFGVEIGEATMPQEAGLHHRAVSYTKGCYIGQETVARLYWKGKPNRHLRGLRLSAPVAPGASLRLGEQPVGTLGSVTDSPRLGVIGLALVRREAEVGALLDVGEGAASATVVELPF